MTLFVRSMNYSIFAGMLRQIPLTKKLLITTINQYSYCIAEQDPEFKEALHNSDILLPEGEGIVKAVQVLTGQKVKKIAGADLHFYLLGMLDKNYGRCFYLGSSDITLKKIRERIKHEYPNITSGFYSPPYKNQFSEQENADMVKAVNTFKPDVLFVGMTAPKQEKWAYQHKPILDGKLICCIGAVFDFYAGTIQRPDKIWIDLGLEWLIRLTKEPKRMWKRYLYFGPIFVYLILKKKFQQ